MTSIDQELQPQSRIAFPILRHPDADVMVDFRAVKRLARHTEEEEATAMRQKLRRQFPPEPEFNMEEFLGIGLYKDRS